jgi:hypothetical protein
MFPITPPRSTPTGIRTRFRKVKVSDLTHRRWGHPDAGSPGRDRPGSNRRLTPDVQDRRSCHRAAGQLATAESNRALPAYQTGPVDRLGRGQRMRHDSNVQGRKARPGSSRVPSPVGLRIHGRIAEVPPPSPGTGARPGSSRRLLLGSFTILGRPSTAESGEFESLPSLGALVSSEARPLAGSLSMRCALRAGGNPLTHPRH